jgi:hypothetical protein
LSADLAVVLFVADLQIYSMITFGFLAINIVSLLCNPSNMLDAIINPFRKLHISSPIGSLSALGAYNKNERSMYGGGDSDCQSFSCACWS